jgi:capsular polysaccharide biosynthesis protein
VQGRLWPPKVAAVVAAVILGGIAAAVAAAIVASRPPVYTASAAVAVDQPRLVATGSDLQVDKLSRIRAKYGPLVDTDTILGPLAAQLGTSSDYLRASLTTVSPLNSLLIVVTARTGKAGDSRRFANGAAEYLSTFADDEQRSNGIPADQRFILSVVDRAKGAQKLRPTRKRETAAAAIAGVVVLVGAYAAVQLARREPH